MTASMTALVTASAALIGVVIGWLVSGTQRVNEKLVEERRAAYSELLVLATTPAALRDAGVTEVGTPPHDERLRQSSIRATFIASDLLRDSECLIWLGRARPDPPPAAELHRAMELMRLETLRNAQTRMRWHRKRYRQKFGSA